MPEFDLEAEASEGESLRAVGLNTYDPDFD